MSKIDPSDPRLTAYVLNEMTDAERAAFEPMLAGDPAAQVTVAEIRRTIASLSAALEQEPVPASVIEPPLVRAAPRRRPALIPWTLWVPLAAAASFALVYSVSHRPGVSNPSGQNVAATAPAPEEPVRVAVPPPPAVDSTPAAFEPTPEAPKPASPAAQPAPETTAPAPAPESGKPAAEANKPTSETVEPAAAPAAANSPAVPAPAGETAPLAVAQTTPTPPAEAAPAPSADASESSTVASAALAAARANLAIATASSTDFRPPTVAVPKPSLSNAPRSAYAATNPSNDAPIPSDTFEPVGMNAPDSASGARPAQPGSGVPSTACNSRQPAQAHFTSKNDVAMVTPLLARPANGATSSAKESRPPAPASAGAGSATATAKIAAAETALQTRDTYVANGFVAAALKPLALLPANADPAGYRDLCRWIAAGKLPPAGAVRIEEMLNYFRYAYAKPAGTAPLAIRAELQPAPWAAGHRLVRIGVQAQAGGGRAAAVSNVRVQVDFNPARVAAYRLIGYETRAGEPAPDNPPDAKLDAGQSWTALFEVEPAVHGPAPSPREPAAGHQPVIPAVAPSDEWVTVKVHYQAAGSSSVSALSERVLDQPVAAPSDDFQFAAAVAECGLLLQDCPFKGSASWDQVETLARSGLGADEDGHRAEFVELVRKVSALGPPAR